MKYLFLVLPASLILLIALLSTGANALPQYMTDAGQTCGTCHLNPAGGGNYYYIASPEDAPAIFKEELGELGSVLAQNLTVDFAPKHCHLVGVLGFAGAKLPAAAGDVQTGATRSVLFALEVPLVLEGALAVGTVTCGW